MTESTMEKRDILLETLQITPHDRVGGPISTESDVLKSRAPLIRGFIPVAYFAPGLAILLPLGSPDRRLLAAAAVGLASALFGAFILNRTDKHRLRLMITGGGIALTFLHFVLKQFLGK